MSGRRLTVLTPPDTWPRSTSSVRRTRAALGGALASLAAGLGMLLLRSTLQVRSVPERLMEWLLLFVPPTMFEAVLQRFGFDAKRYALDAAIVVMLALLAAVGYTVVQRAWSMGVIFTLGVTLWLLVMVVVMPLTSAGPFARDLLEGQAGVVGGYLAVGLSYAAVLGVAQAWLLTPEGGAWWPARSLRPAIAAPELPRRMVVLGLLGGTGAAYAATYLAALLLPKQAYVPNVILADPQEPVPSGGIEVQAPHPRAVAAAAAEPSPRSTPAAARPALPEPTADRQLTRDKDGAVLPSGRTKGELATAITGTDAFYVVTKNAGGDPVIHPADWRLTIDGEVHQPAQLDYTALLQLPSVEVVKTLECISNFVGKPELAPFGAELISTATWKGARVRDILQFVGGTRPGAEWVAVLGADEYTSALPLDVLLGPDALLVYEMNGQVLPREHGYPARLLLSDRYGMKNAKWIVGLRPVRRELLDWYGQRNWSREGIVRTMARIDTPAPSATLPAGPQAVAGVAYAGARGIKQVEISSDGGGTWQQAELLDATPGEDRWVRWRGEVVLAPGTAMTVKARATDGAGELQVEPFGLPQPDGGTGWPTVEFRAA